jgi:galactokinase
MPSLLEESVGEFRARFGRAADAAACAPGRINLIGEHTDYNGGLVLPFAIDCAALTCVGRRAGTRVEVVSREQNQPGVFELAAGEHEAGEVAAFRKTGSWSDYVSATLHAVCEAGHRLSGMDLWIASDVPLGSGLSSSAALCVSVVTAVDAAYELGLSAIERARLAHRAESHWVGIGCGVLDHFASALAGPDTALRIDCLTQQSEAVPLPPELRLLVADSGVSRSLADAGYRQRVAECSAALSAAIAHGIAAQGSETLRGLRAEDLPALERVLDATSLRRVRHVILENARVEASCDALRAGDLAAVGALLNQGMASLRDDYEVSTPELDRLCEVANAVPGVFGSRLTGAGFGGSTIHLTTPAGLPAAMRALEPLSAGLRVVSPAAPAAALTLAAIS